MSMHFLAKRTPVQVFLGTSAWFFAIVHVAKVPFLAGIGPFDTQTLLMDAVFVPLVIVGAFAGLWLARRMKQQVFDRIVIVLTITMRSTCCSDQTLRKTAIPRRNIGDPSPSRRGFASLRKRWPSRGRCPGTAGHRGCLAPPHIPTSRSHHQLQARPRRSGSVRCSRWPAS